MITIYLICSEIGDEKRYKIGYTRRTVEQRIKEFKTGNASEFTIVDTFKTKWGTKVEAALHRRLKHKKVSGEWFVLDEEDVQSFNETCQQIHDNFEVLSTSTYYLERGDFY